MESEGELWQVEIDNLIHETDLVSLKNWISEGRVLPSDKVKKGNLNWIAAHRVPALRGAFSPSAFSTSPVPIQTGPSPSESEKPTTPPSSLPESRTAQDSAGSNPLGMAISSCRTHPERAAAFVCRICNAPFCKECPTFIGPSRIPTCPLCGDLCLSLVEREKHTSTPVRAEDAAREVISRGRFGSGALVRALRYPFSFPGALIGASLIYGFLLMGSFVGMRSGLMAVMLANGLLFGCLAQVVKQVAWGRFQVNFLGGFDSFNLWDNAIRPTLFGFGIMLVTFGPLVFLLLAMMTGWLGNSSDLPNSAEHQIAESQKQAITGEELDALINSKGGAAEEKALEKMNRMTPANQANQMIADKTPKPESTLLEALAKQYLTRVPAWILGMLGLALLWALWYYPMALAVAGYSEDFGSILNPLVGLDTVKRMRIVYWTVFLMYLGVQGIGIVLNLAIMKATISMSLPLMGNIPAQILKGIVTFYTSLVVAYLLGLSLHHCAPELNIPTD
jgi:hypothetical protein